MASETRAAALRASLLKELETTLPLPAAPPLARLRWIRNEIENYLDRWIAFAAFDDIPLKSLLADDLFAMVLIAIDVYEQELRRSSYAHRAQWDRFVSQISQLQRSRDRREISQLRLALDAVIHELP